MLAKTLREVQAGDYMAAIQKMDFYVGQIVDVVERLEIADETIIMYVSDNGRQGGRNENQPIRGSKLTTYEGGLRVPCIAYCPGIVREDYTASVVSYAMDWYPTLASLAGISVPEEVVLDGRDLSSLLSGETDDIPLYQRNVSLNAEIPLRRKFHLYRSGRIPLQKKNTLTHFSITEVMAHWRQSAQESGN